jgi:hypothetical protein
MSGNSSPKPLTRDSSPRPVPKMSYWIHVARSIDRVTLHKERCSEVPSTSIGSSSDFWEGGWFDYPDKERALAAMEQAGTTEQRRCQLCKA